MKNEEVDTKRHYRVVSPDDVTTIVTNKYQLGIAFCTARATLRHLMTGRVRGVDASGYDFSWDGTASSLGQPVNALNWQARNLQYFDDQPALRSGSSSGEITVWPIPTVIICTNYFGYKVRKNEKVNLRKLYRHYKGICQLCLTRGPIAEMTIDHVYPRSLGGSNHDFNLVLAHRSCNHAKGAQTPFLNILGQEVKARPMLRTGVMMPDIPMREEWKPYMMID